MRRTPQPVAFMGRSGGEVSKGTASNQNEEEEEVCQGPAFRETAHTQTHKHTDTHTHKNTQTHTHTHTQTDT